MKTLICVMAHAGAADTFTRHLPFWKEHINEGAELMFAFPEGQAIRETGFPAIEVGKAQHDGPIAILRFRTILEHMAGLPGYDRYIFMEYDSFILGRLPQLNFDFAGNLFTDDSPDWIGKSFIHPPWMCDENALRKIVAEMAKMPLAIEKGMWDRMLGLATERAGLQRKSWIQSGYGWAKNTLHADDSIPTRNAILNGSRAIHGCKSEEMFNVIAAAWRLGSMKDELLREGLI
jgi:hypothetical protein